MAYEILQTTSCYLQYGIQYPVELTFLNPVTQGSALIVFYVGLLNLHVGASATDTQGNTWYAQVTENGMIAYWTPNAKAGVTTVYLSGNFDGSPDPASNTTLFMACEVGGPPIGFTVDAVRNAPNYSYLTSFYNEIVICVVSQNNAPPVPLVPDSGSTEIDQQLSTGDATGPVTGDNTVYVLTEYQVADTPYTEVMFGDGSPDFISVRGPIIGFGTPSSPSTGNIVIQKETVPSGSPQVFTFTPSWGDTFTLTDGQSNDSGPLSPGTYSVVETPVEGWESVSSQSATEIVVVSGQTTTVTFINTYILTPENIYIKMAVSPVVQGKFKVEHFLPSAPVKVDILQTLPEVPGAMWEYQEADDVYLYLEASDIQATAILTLWFAPGPPVQNWLGYWDI